MRVVAGEARGIRLAPVPEGVRPTADRVREALFNSLGQFFDGGEVLDLYAGTGALGIEALSRGCERATFVEKSGRTAGVIRENLRRTRFEGRAEVVRGDARGEVERLVREGREYRLIFADPPYRIAGSEIGEVLPLLIALLAPGGRVVVESGAPLDAEQIASAKGVSRRYGGTIVTIFERSEGTMDVAICPGSFDPVTSGHLDVIRRASHLFDHVVVAVGRNVRKNTSKLPADDRARLIEKVTKPLENVSVEIMEGLLVNFAREQGARVVVKGLRAGSDFESEFQQAQLNRTLYSDFETVFIMAAAEHSFLSSSAVREIASLGGSVKGLVPDEILETVQSRYYVPAEGSAAESDKG
ncbi:pantetheine-phosphate adenylyltransferase [Rubrobacter marinus]|uniref:Phosphopantetheine adenylyltransferase n=1 Tax=Rubrobacter marinus TaxID=2653852 RepID=A0A6G8PXN9_9ACTN|nr:pantetheine-phosphate adenylyltransferase [Rubrobacter marinus]QIN78956.1 pantetheine-phosphate adenylyltransferase [Rubrobacter marinus]